MQEQKTIVVLGAGFGGLKAAITVAKGIRALQLTNTYQVILIDKNDYHTYSPKNIYRCGQDSG